MIMAKWQLLRWLATMLPPVPTLNKIKIGNRWHIRENKKRSRLLGWMINSNYYNTTAGDQIYDLMAMSKESHTLLTKR